MNFSTQVGNKRKSVVENIQLAVFSKTPNQVVLIRRPLVTSEKLWGRLETLARTPSRHRDSG